MPHCEKEVYELVISHSNLDRLAILGNSFQKYKERSIHTTHSKMSIEYWADKLTERKMPPFKRNTYAFGDMAFISF